jgi:hypothetical protein
MSSSESGTSRTGRPIRMVSTDSSRSRRPSGRSTPLGLSSHAGKTRAERPVRWSKNRDRKRHRPGLFPPDPSTRPRADASSDGPIISSFEADRRGAIAVLRADHFRFASSSFAEDCKSLHPDEQRERTVNPLDMGSETRGILSPLRLPGSPRPRRSARQGFFDNPRIAVEQRQQDPGWPFRRLWRGLGHEHDAQSVPRLPLSGRNHQPGSLVVLLLQPEPA